MEWNGIEWNRVEMNDDESSDEWNRVNRVESSGME